jgi:multidrug efflux pump subunit AcrA (membrane-fusion protein)
MRAFAALLASAILACGQPAEKAEQAEPAPVRVRVTAAHRGSMTSTLDVVGETVALDVIRLASPIAGRVTAIATRPGDRLAAGSAVARVLPLEADAAARGFDLLAGATASDRQEPANVARLRRQVLTREAILRAPFDAIVSNRLRNPGEQVASGDVVVELFAPRSLHVVAQVPLEAIGRVRPGTKVEVDGETLHSGGRVTAVLPSLTPVALSVPVRVTLAAVPERAIVGAPVHCRIVVRHRRNALLVPRSALVSARESGNRGELMIDRQGAVALRSVRLGMRSASEIEVRAGLAEAERVLVDGQYALPDGTPIEPLDAAETP